MATTSTFYFRAVGSDGKIRSGSITADTERMVARELAETRPHSRLRRGHREKGHGLQTPQLRREEQTRRSLFFTQELSTLLTSGVPLDRALAITAEITERPHFRFVVLDILRVPQRRPLSRRFACDPPRILLRPFHQHGARR